MCLGPQFTRAQHQVLAQRPPRQPPPPALPEGFVFVRKLANGKFGDVLHAKAPNNSDVALKVNKRTRVCTSFEVWMLNQEVQNLCTMPQHPNLAKLVRVITSSRSVYVCLQYAGPVNLFQFQATSPYPKLTNAMTRVIFPQITSALECLHEHFFSHRDIKPENVVLNNPDPSTPHSGMSATLVDFDLAVKSMKPLRTSCGSLPFAAPEVLDVPKEGFMGGPADMFALGVTFLEARRGSHALRNALGWTSSTTPSRSLAIRLREVLASGVADIGCTTGNDEETEPPELTTLIESLVQDEPEKRWTATVALECPWFIRKDSE